MSGFTNEDEICLEAYLEAEAPEAMYKHFEALLARLECAEKALNTPHKDDDFYPESNCPGCKAIQAWRASKGEGK